jgi:hypothetical protein
MTYRILSQSLWPLADSVRKYLKDHRGLGHIKVEEEIDKEVPRPTLHALDKDKSIVCVDFLEDSCFGVNSQTFVNKCKARQLPVRLYIACPESAQKASFARDLKTARENGVGVLGVSSAGNITVISEAISLLLTDLRRQDPKDFPPKYRGDLELAHQTYLQGNPPKGCAAIYDMVEALTRAIAKNLQSQKLIAPWQSKPINLDKVAWFKVADDIYKHLDFAKAKKLTKPLWAQVIAATRPRNETGHQPKSVQERIRRDKELRTRFEAAGDLLRNLIDATHGWGI